MTDTETQTTSAKKPTHIAYTVIEGKKPHWQTIRAAWAHKKDGFTIQLNCIPFDRKIVLRLADSE